MPRWSPEHHEPLTPPEQIARDRRMAPGPFQDAVASMFISGVTAHSTAQFFNLNLTEVAGIVTWVCDANLRGTHDS